jgi:hypothetical protein
MNRFKHELLCQNCDREHPVWYAPNRLWDEVVKDPDAHALCPTCFWSMAEDAGYKSIWFFGPDAYLTQEVKDEFIKR